jgi:uncharacterized protein YbjT (DUF2867 family)
MFAVAGVSGQTGAAVAEALLAAGESIRVIVRKPEAGNAWRARGAEVAVADLTDVPAMTAALHGTRGAWLLNPPRYDQADPFAQAGNVGAAVAAALNASGIPRAVVLSSVGAHQAAGTGIIGTAHQFERALAGVTTPIALLRANYFFENWNNVLGAVRASDVLPTFLDPLARAIPMAAVADIGIAAAELLRGPAWTGTRTIDFASFDASPADVAAAFGSVLGKTVKAVAVPQEQQAGILQSAGFRPEIAAAFVQMYEGINGGVAVAAAGSERRRGSTTLVGAARALAA